MLYTLVHSFAYAHTQAFPNLCAVLFMYILITVTVTVTVFIDRISLLLLQNYFTLLLLLQTLPILPCSFLVFICIAIYPYITHLSLCSGTLIVYTQQTQNWTFGMKLLIQKTGSTNSHIEHYLEAKDNQITNDFFVAFLCSCGETLIDVGRISSLLLLFGEHICDDLLTYVAWNSLSRTWLFVMDVSGRCTHTSLQVQTEENPYRITIHVLMHSTHHHSNPLGYFEMVVTFVNDESLQQLLI